MNKREREDVAAMVAEWEWIPSGSASEAAARYSCAKEVIDVLKLQDADVLFARQWEILRRMGSIGDDDISDALDDMVERDGYDAVVSLIESSGFEGLRAALAGAKP